MTKQHSVEGIWTGELYGAYGWENSGVYVLENGRILGGNNRHYSVGTYRMSGTVYEASIVVHYYGPPRTIFGEDRERFEIEVTGEFEDDEISAKVVRPDRPDSVVRYRMTRRMELPAA